MTTQIMVADYVDSLFMPLDVVEIRRLPSGVSTWHEAKDLPNAVDKLERDNANGENIYIGANPRTRRGGTTAADVRCANCLFADFDGIGWDEVQQRIQAAGLPSPTLVVNSGHGVHIWYRLSEPLTDLAVWTSWQRDLIAALDSDPAIHDAPRIMRVAGFKNWKPPVADCEIIDASPNNVYDLADLSIPERETRPIGPVNEGRPIGPPTNSKGNGSQLSLKAKALAYLAKVPPAVEGSGGDNHTYGAACRLKDLGIDRATALDAMREWNRSCAPPWSDDELSEKVDHAFKYGRYAPGCRADVPRDGDRKSKSTRLTLIDPEQTSVSPILPSPIDAADLCRDNPTLRPPIIEGLLRRGEVGNIVSSPKMHKSFSLLDLAVCVVQGKSWLGFATHPGKVLVLDFELAKPTISHRLGAVLSARGLYLDDITGRLKVESFRGRRGVNVNTLKPYFESLEPRAYDLVICDPLYKMYPPQMDENSNAAIAEVYTSLTEYAEGLDAAVIVCHHLSKGDQSEKAITDLGAGGGSQSRAADCHLGLRPHATDGAAVLGGVVRSWPPFDPFAIVWNYPLWETAPDLDPTDLRKPARRQPKPKDPEPEKPPEAEWSPLRFAVEIVTRTPKVKATILADAGKAGLASRRAEALLRQAEVEGLVYRHRHPTDRRLILFSTEPEGVLDER